MQITEETVVGEVTFAKNIKTKGRFIHFEFDYEESTAQARVKDDLSLVEVGCSSMTKELEEGFAQEIKEKLTRLA